jgi:hypothetical protein
MFTKEECPVCNNIDGAGIADCPGHIDDEVEGHDCLAPAICGQEDPFSIMAGISGDIVYCKNARHN